MSTGITRLGLILVAGLCLLTLPAMAGTIVTQGNTVFIGEQGLDITAALGNNDTAIGWWAPAADISSTSPTSQVTVSTPSSFYVAPAQFSGYTGTWYRVNAEGKADGPAFIVADPTLELRVLDTTINNLDVTDKWVPRGDEVGFRIDTNLNQVFTRGGSSNGGITIYVQSPDGAQYSALVDAGGNTHSLENIQVTVPSYTTGSVWNTGNSLYPAGSYTIWAECNANNLKDNYAVTGKTISSRTSLLDQEQNPLISGASTGIQTTSATTVATTVTTVPTTTPATTLTTATPSGTVTETTVPETQVPVNTTPVSPGETAPTQSPGFGVILALVSLCSLGIVLKLRNQ